MRGGTADKYLCFFFVQPIGREKVGGSDGRVRNGGGRCAGLLSTRSYFLPVYLQGSGTAGGGSVLALTTVRTVHVGVEGKTDGRVQERHI